MKVFSDGTRNYEATLAGLREANSVRVKRWHGPAGVDDWSITDWSNAVAGECGEMCNAVKKLRRIEGNLKNINTEPGRQLSTAIEAIHQIGREMADQIIYIDLLANKLGVDLHKAIAEKFNEKSVEYGFPERLVS